MSYPVQNQNQGSSDSYEAQLRKMQEEYNGTGDGSDYNSDLEGNDQPPVKNVDPGFLDGNYGLKFSSSPGMGGGGKAQPLTVDALRSQLNDLETKINASTDLSSKQKNYILDEIEKEMSQVNYAVSETGEAQQTTLTDVKTAMGDISSAMTGAPKADDLIKQIDDLTKQCNDAKVPSDSKDDLKKWKEDLGKMKSKLELDPGTDNQKAAQDLIKQVTGDLKKATDAQAAADKAAAKVPEDMMKKLEALGGGKLNQTFILQRLYNSYPEFDTNNDGEISMDEFGKAIENKSFPPSTPNTKLLQFLYAIDPDLQDSINSWVQGAHWDDDNNYLAAGEGKDAEDAQNEVMLCLKALYPDAGIGPDPSDTQSAFIFDNEKIDILNLSGYEVQNGDSVDMTGKSYDSVLQWMPNSKVK